MKNIIFYEKIAVGGMSTVFKGKYNDINVVIKKLHEHLSEDMEFIERFRREAEILKRLRHPNVIRFISFERIENDYFLILEYVDGENLGEIIKKRGIPLTICINFALQIAQGIYFAHKNGIVHRDIKPTNILISKNGIVKILDFGLAYEEGIKFTDPGVYIGTPAYIAPEVLSGKNYSVISDVFSFGVLLYEMISCKNPFYAKTPYEIINNILYKKPEKLKIIDKLNDLVFSMISKNPDDRIKNFREIIDRLKEFKMSNRKEIFLWLNEKIELDKAELIIREKNYSPLFGVFILFILILTSFFITKIIKREKNITNKEDVIDTTMSDIVKPETLNIEEKKIDKFEKKLSYEKKVIDDSGIVLFDIKGDGEILINGEFYKNAPLYGISKVKTGDYLLSFKSKEGFTIEKKFSIAKQETILVKEILLYSYLKIKVEPWGYVFIDGENNGMTPLTPIRLKPGTHKLTITNPKFNEWSKEIYINGGETVFINVELK